MLPMSLKSVPGCLTLIEPTGIGVPVAATPGFVPQLEVSLDPPLDPPLDELVAVVDDEPEAAGALLEVLLVLLLEPQAARASSARTATSAMPNRARSEPWSILTLISSSYE